jgi:hypothetical protein
MSLIATATPLVITPSLSLANYTDALLAATHGSTGNRSVTPLKTKAFVSYRLISPTLNRTSDHRYKAVTKGGSDDNGTSTVSFLEEGLFKILSKNYVTLHYITLIFRSNKLHDIVWLTIRK